MSIDNVKWILAREIRDQLRDRRTTFMIFVLPLLLYPLLGVSLMQISQFMLKKPSKVLVLGAPQLSEMPPLFADNRFAGELFGDPESAQLMEVSFARSGPYGGSDELPQEMEGRRELARELIEEDEFDAAVVFPSNFGEQLQRARQAVIGRAMRPTDDSPSPDDQAIAVPSPEIIPNSSRAKSELTCELLRNVLRTWSDRIGDANLAASQVPIVAARPFVPTIDRTPLDEQRRSARFWAQLFPICMVLWALTGAFYPAVDLCAGEKERGTLETLLSSPAQRSEIVLGKLVTIMLFSMATSVLNMLSIGVTGLAVMQMFPHLGPPPWTAWVWLPIALVPVSALFSALCLALAAFARSTKEGQYYLVPLLLVSMPLIVAPLSPSVELTIGNALIPVTGLVLLLRTLLEGQLAQALPMIVPVAAVTLGCCLLAIRWAVEQFNSESVLFRESERLDVRLWLRHLVRDREPTPTAAAAVACGVLILCLKFFLSLRGGMPGSFAELARGALLTQNIMVLAPTLLLTALLVSSPRRTLLLTWPRWKVLAAAAALAVVFHPVAIALQGLVVKLYPIADEFTRLSQSLQEILTATPFWKLVLVMALLPAVYEELAFRGFILSGFRRLGHKWRAIIYSALFFGFAHGILQQSVLTAIVGTLIGYIAVKSGSIVPGMVFHFIHNSLAVGLMKISTQPDALGDWPVLRNLWPALEQLTDATSDTSGGGLSYHPGVVAAGLVVTAGLLAWLSLQPHEKSLEEQRVEAMHDAQ